MRHRTRRPGRHRERGPAGERRARGATPVRPAGGAETEAPADRGRQVSGPGGALPLALADGASYSASSLPKGGVASSLGWSW